MIALRNKNNTDVSLLSELKIATNTDFQLYEDIRTLYTVVKTTVQMMTDRGYKVLGDEIDVSTLQNFVRSNYYYLHDPSSTHDIYSHMSRVWQKAESKESKRNDVRPTYVYFYNRRSDPDKAQVSISSIERFVGILTNLKATTGLIYDIVFITPIKIASRGLSNLNVLPVYKNIFLHSQLQYNITHHLSNSKFQILSNEEKKKFLKENRIVDPEKIPGIYYNDPMCTYYGARVGQIIRLTRRNLYHNSNLDYSISYRIVVPYGVKTRSKQTTLTDLVIESGSDSVDDLSFGTATAVETEVDIYEELDREVEEEAEEDLDVGPQGELEKVE
jgi:DNA-directed RNA polymerase subunit H (RpoH/RPB5)